jgi:cytosine deaminase
MMSRAHGNRAYVTINEGLGKVLRFGATDLYLMGRRDVRNIRRGLAPIKRLLAGGVIVATSSNNVRIAFTPVGNASLPLMGYLLTVGAHMGTTRDIQQTLDMVTTYPARLLRLPDYGLTVGSRADIVLWDTARPEEIITALATPRLVVKRGRITVEHERTVREIWRSPG